jgi:hypothetical protein
MRTEVLALLLVAAGMLAPRAVWGGPPDGSGSGQTNPKPVQNAPANPSGGSRVVPGQPAHPGHGNWDVHHSPYWDHQNYYRHGVYSKPLGVSARIVNPANNGVTLTFSINHRLYALAPGMHQDVPYARGHHIEFDRGSGHGLARYSLDGAVFRFAPTPNGWDLFRRPFAAAAGRSIASSNPPAPGSGPPGAGNPPVVATGNPAFPGPGAGPIGGPGGGPAAGPGPGPIAGSGDAPPPAPDDTSPAAPGDTSQAAPANAGPPEQAPAARTAKKGPAAAQR